jgi:histone-lysine N-methyltransferase SETMAR
MELFAILAIGKDVVDKIIHQLGYAKVCARWVPRSLTEEHKEQRKIVFSELLARYEAEGEDFLSTIVTSDKTWIYHFQPQTKRQSMEWHHATSGKKTFKAISSASKIMATVFWDSEGVILIDMLPRGQTINFDVYVETLKKHFRRVRPHKDVTSASSPRQCEATHTSLHTLEAITKLQWTVLPHPPYGLDLSPSYYHLFSPLKDAIRGKSLRTTRKSFQK